MRVHIIDIDQGTGAETYRTTCDLVECFTDDYHIDGAYHEALADLERCGRHRIGGGAAPLTLMLDAGRNWIGYEDDYGQPGGRTTRLPVTYGR